jgi:arabinose-5-phosphate isomerase
MNYKECIVTELSSIANINIKEIEPFIIEMYNSNKGRLITSGMGKAGLVANFLSTTLCSVGYSSSFLHPAESQHGDLGVIRDGDAILCFSNSGKTKELIEMIELVKKWKPDVKIFSIVGSSDSKIGELSDHSFVYGPVEEICPMGLVPSTSTTCMSVICDLISAQFTELHGTTPSIYNQLHHGGYLGVKSSNQ